MSEEGCTMPFEIGPGSDSEIDRLVDLEEACFVGYYRPHRLGPAEFADYIEGVRRILYVAKLNGELAGYVAGVVRKPRGNTVADMDSLAVQPEFRTRGIGTRLLNTFIAEAKDKRCTQVMITVAVPNAGATRFFSKRGFRKIGRLADYYGDGVDGILMRLDV